VASRLHVVAHRVDLRTDFSKLAAQLLSPKVKILNGRTDLICALKAIDEVARAAILPRCPGGTQLITCPAALHDPGFDDRDLALPCLKVTFCV
jgi:hypothetical protein